MKTLIVYYSRSNFTKQVAEAIQKELNCNIEEIKTSVNYSGPLGYAKGIKDSVQEKIIPINDIKFNPSEYDRIIIGTPVWTSKLSNPILSYLDANKSKLNNISLFITGKSNGFEKVKDHVEKVTGLKVEKFIDILQKDIEKNNFNEKINYLIN